MKIAICDDDVQELDRVSSLLNTYGLENDTPFVCKTFTNAPEFLATLSYSNYDMLFLDILLPGITGLMAAQQIRKIDTEVKIVFLSSSPEFEVESHALNPYAYLIKPTAKDRLFSLLDGLIAERQKRLENLTVNTPSAIVRVMFSELAFVEITNKELYFNLADGRVLHVLSPLADIERDLLSRPEFIKVHRSYLVNLEQVAELRAKDLLTLARKTIPISRLLYDKVREAYMQHLFLEKGVE